MYSRPGEGEFSLKLCNAKEVDYYTWWWFRLFLCHVEPNEPSAAAAIHFEKYKLSFSWAWCCPVPGQAVLNSTRRWPVVVVMILKLLMGRVINISDDINIISSCVLQELYCTSLVIRTVAGIYCNWIRQAQVKSSLWPFFFLFCHINWLKYS